MKKSTASPYRNELPPEPEERHCQWCHTILPDAEGKHGAPPRYCNRTHRQFWNQRNYLNIAYSRLQAANRHV